MPRRYSLHRSLMSLLSDSLLAFLLRLMTTHLQTEQDETHSHRTSNDDGDANEIFRSHSTTACVFVGVLALSFLYEP